MRESHRTEGVYQRREKRATGMRTAVVATLVAIASAAAVLAVYYF